MSEASADDLWVLVLQEVNLSEPLHLSGGGPITDVSRNLIQKPLSRTFTAT